MTSESDNSTEMGHRVLRTGGWSVIINGWAVLVITLAHAGIHAAAVVIAGLIGITVAAAHAYPGRQVNASPIAPTGTWTLSRSLLVATAGTLTARDGGETLSWVALGVIALCVVLESTLRAVELSATPVSLRLPGIDLRTRQVIPVRWVYGVNTTIVALALVHGASSLAPAIVAVGAAVTLGITATALVDAGLRAVANFRARSRLHAALSNYGPSFLLHWQAPAGTAYQVAMWLPHLDRIGQPYVIVVRTETNLRELAERTGAPIILRKALEDLDDVVVPSLKVVFYLNTAVRNCHMIRYSNLTHIQLNHGDSDKVPSFNPVFRMFDRNFVAGQAAIDRFAKNGVWMPTEMFRIVGRPQVEDVTVADRPISEVASPTVLYAPTWSGFYADSNYSSLGVGPQMVAELVARGCTVVFRPHPYARRTRLHRDACDRIIAILERDRTENGRQHIFGPAAEAEMSVIDCFNAADAMLSDVSSVLSDFLYSRKPFAVVAVAGPPEQLTEEIPLSRGAYVVDAHEGTVAGLDETLTAMLGPDPRAQERDALRTYYLGDIPTDGYARRFLDEARSYL